MNKLPHLFRFVQYLFDDAETARKATRIIDGIWDAAFHAPFP
jgi:hypothetical protein